ncbi:hypothetical protein U1Q18_002231 [Sarracenia purpurea var. burkii]
MSLDGAVERRKETQTGTGTGAGNGSRNGVVSPAVPSYSTHRLRLNPNTDHKPDSYEDLQLEYLPPSLLNVSREAKVQYMREILLRYSPEGERTRVQKHREYRQKIISNYQVTFVVNLGLMVVCSFVIETAFMDLYHWSGNSTQDELSLVVRDFPDAFLEELFSTENSTSF